MADEVGHAMGRKQAGLGTPIPRTLIVALGPKARSSWLPGEALVDGPRCHRPQMPTGQALHVSSAWAATPPLPEGIRNRPKSN